MSDSPPGVTDEHRAILREFVVAYDEMIHNSWDDANNWDFDVLRGLALRAVKLEQEGRL